MRTKRHSPNLQLCLFSEAEMSAMAEAIEPVPAIEVSPDPLWLVWQTDIGHSLKGRDQRRHFRFLTQKRARPKVVAMQPTELLARAG